MADCEEDALKGGRASPTVTIASYEPEQEDVLVHRRPFVSRHRRLLDRIRTDSALSRSHAVPVGSSNTDTLSGNSFLRTDRIRRSQIVERALPMWSWLKTYNWRSTLPKDLIAGLTVGVMITPQSMVKSSAKEDHGVERAF